jgi:hypothetical protein
MRDMTKITKESLAAFGMQDVKDPGVSMEKLLGGTDEDCIALQVTHYRNVPEIVLCLPGGHLLYLNVSSIEELTAFEKCISSFEPNY